MSHLPVQLIVATQEGMWHNREIETVHELTHWPLHRLNMRHVSLATSAEHARPFVQLIMDSVDASQRYPRRS